MKEKFADNHGHNILSLFDGWVNLALTNYKWNEAWSLLISWCHELPRELPNNLRLTILGN